jgi:glutaredoxin 3
MDSSQFTVGKINMSADIIIYTTRYCPFCVRAKSLLVKKGLAFKEISVDGDEVLRREMQQKAKQRTVPQIWINNQHIGGCTDLEALEYAGKLDQIIAQS